MKTIDYPTGAVTMGDYESMKRRREIKEKYREYVVVVPLKNK